MTTTLSREQNTGHIWIEGVHLGAGEEQICRQCGIRQSDRRAGVMCAELQRAILKSVPPKHEYDPFQ